MHHMTLKSAVAKHFDEFKEAGEESVKATLAASDFSQEEIDEIIDALKNGGKPSEQKDDKESEIEKLRKENEQLRKLAAGGMQGPFVKKIERPKMDPKKPLRLYDMYKVQKDLEQEFSEEGDVVKTKFTGNFIKVGNPIKTNIKVEPYRAKIFNDQSVNSGERLYPVED